jgi:Uma2 family endonuclease
MSLVNVNSRYTYKDYRKWDDGERWELIEGLPYMLSPAPSPIHQGISREIAGQLYNFLKGGPCKLFTAPFDVRLNADKADNTVVQPDLLVICDSSKIDDKGCSGAPDLVIEILSASTIRHDRIIKFRLYQKAGVREYWIVDPETQSIQTCTLNENGFYITAVYYDEDVVPVSVLPGCAIHLQEIFT